MDILAFLLGYKKGASQNTSIDEVLDEVDDYLDAINGEIVGENALTVTFIGADGSTLCTMPAFEGYDCEDPIASGVIETPIKASTAIYDYTFAGWSDTADGTASSDILSNITADKTVYAVFSSSWNFIAQGTCDDSGEETQVQWGLHSNNTLRIWGTGSFNGGGYENYKARTTRVIVGEGITILGTAAFYGHNVLTSITLPSTLETIGTHCFSQCSALKSIRIPAPVTSLLGSALAGTVLTSVYFAQTSGWKVKAAGSSTWQSISADDLSVPATAAQYVTETYRDYAWKRGD